MIFYDMGQEEILQKLNRELNKKIKNECQVIFILSRIRKFLELKDLKTKYKILNFYCNWALHVKIDRTDCVRSILKDFIEHKDNDRFLFLEDFKDELKIFLEDFDLPMDILKIENYKPFFRLLVDIYSDTPVEFRYEQKKIIKMNKQDKFNRIPFWVSFTIRDN